MPRSGTTDLLCRRDQRPPGSSAASSCHPTSSRICHSRPGPSLFPMWPGGMLARERSELLRSIACQMCVATETPGGFGSLAPSPTSHEPSGAWITSRAGSTPSSAVRCTTAPRAAGNSSPSNGNGKCWNISRSVPVITSVSHSSAASLLTCRRGRALGRNEPDRRRPPASPGCPGGGRFPYVDIRI